MRALRVPGTGVVEVAHARDGRGVDLVVWPRETDTVAIAVPLTVGEASRLSGMLAGAAAASLATRASVER